MSLFNCRSVLISVASLALTGGSTLCAVPAIAQPLSSAAPVSTGTLRIAIANPAHIFNDMAETKALQAQMKQQQQQFEQDQRGKVADIEDMRNRRDTLDPNHQQWEDLNAGLSKKVAEYKVWAETQKAMAESVQKQKMRTLFKKIEDTVAEVAKRDAIDLVIADNRDALPTNLDEVDVRALRGVLLSREVLYSGPQTDVSEKVLTLLDARFRGLANGTGAVPTFPAGANK